MPQRRFIGASGNFNANEPFIYLSQSSDSLRSLSGTLLEIEQITSSVHIVKVVLCVKANVVTCNRGENLRDLGVTKGLNGIIRVRAVSLDGSILLVEHDLSGLLRNETILQIEGEVLVNEHEHVKIDGLSQ